MAKPKDELEPPRFELEELRARAKFWLTKEGQKELVHQLREDLLVTYQIETVEGQQIREGTRSGPTAARQSRRQQLQLAELIYKLTVLKDEEGEG